ncbi:MAG TPA: hypothetical protein VD995_10965 [Azospirillum sp.]|nr:hypothetical protein [Azospirillum sp.]
MNTSDPEVEAFILKAPRTMTYSDLERAIRGRFGAERAWSAQQVAVFWSRTEAAVRRTHSRLATDDEVRRFVDDRLFRLTLNQVLDACTAEFGAARTPSRSALHRYSQQLKMRLGAGDDGAIPAGTLQEASLKA